MSLFLKLEKRLIRGSSMKVGDLLNEVQESEGYRKFKSENPDAFFSAGFFILNLKDGSESIQMDFFIPSKKKIAAFEFPFGEAKIFEEEVLTMMEQGVEVKYNIDDLESVCRKIIRENDSAVNPTKIIAILKDGLWNLTCMDDALGIVRIKLDAVSGDLFNFDKGSLMDFMGVKK
jgi:hypothetical protein